MCLGAPGQIVHVEGSRAIVDFWGVQREVGLDLVDEPVTLGDYVLVHVGFAIRRIPHEEIDETLAFFTAMSGAEEPPGSPRPLPLADDPPRPE